MAAASNELSVVLNTARLRHGISALAGVALGLGLVLKTNTLGIWVGYVALAWGLYHGAWWVFSSLRGAATLAVTASSVTLPHKAYAGAAANVAPADISAAYLLRHASPWNMAAPTLVIEAGQTAYVYPRDWFTGEADQRRVIDALASRIH